MINSNKNAVAGLRWILNMMQCFSCTIITTGSAVETNGRMSQCVMIENVPILMHRCLLPLVCTALLVMKQAHKKQCIILRNPPLV